MAALAMPVQACCTALVIALLLRARMLHPLWSSLHAYLLLSAIVLLAWRTVDLIRGQLNLKAYQQPRAHWPQLGAVALRVAVWLLMAVAVDVAMPEKYFRHQAESPIKSWSAAGVLVLTALLPRRRRWEPSDVLFVVLLAALAFDVNRALNERAGVALDVKPPFEYPSYVLNGGGGLLVNEHARYPGWTGATDLFPLIRGGRLCAGEGLSAFPCFGAAVFAPVSGRIVRVIRERPDMPLGKLDQEVPTGNSLNIQTADGRYLFLAYLMQSTILVREGDRVAAGQEIARCGNSGAAGMPHLLVQAQDRPAPFEEGQHANISSLRFVDALRVRADAFREGPVFVRRNDIIRPLAVDDLQ
jgi:hypothetical protein